MSQSGLSGFSWPIGAPGAPKPTDSVSEPIVSPSQSAAVSSSTSILGSIGPKVPQTTPSPSSIASTAGGPRTTRIQVTHTITVPALPDVTDLSFQMFDAASGSASISTLPTAFASPASNLGTVKEDTFINNVTIAGGVIGGIFALSLIILLIKWCSKRHAEPDLEQALRAQKKRDSKDVLDEVQRRADKIRMAREAAAMKSDAEKRVEMANVDVWNVPAKYHITQMYGGGTFPGPQFPDKVPARKPVPGHEERGVSPTGSQDGLIRKSSG